MIAELARPRRATHALLLLGGTAIGFLAFDRLTIGLMAWASGLAGPYCLLCATAVWSLRDKADSALAADHLDVQAYRQRREAARRLRARFLSRAAGLALCALAAASPAFASQLAHAVWQWMMVAAGAAVGEAAYGFLLAHAWNEQLRLAKEADVERHRTTQEHDALVKALEAAALRTAASGPDVPQPLSGWTGAAGVLESRPFDRF
ncbi:MAG: hypothetical protein JWQ11_4055 [Rhizobacter sp.]|nr:hypothetical protein [Rhizobacter sp.]